MLPSVCNIGVDKTGKNCKNNDTKRDSDAYRGLCCKLRHCASRLLDGRARVKAIFVREERFGRARRSWCVVSVCQVVVQGTTNGC